jgi:putative ABC transport system ATP-binding protein
VAGAGAAPVALERVNHFYGAGGLRKQVLRDLSFEIRPGEIVILTGPSGSGKTTALTLIGALRTPQEGSLRVLGEELVGASRAACIGVRRQIGYIFQHHNLLEALSARQNVELGLFGVADGAAARRRAEEMLEAVGLGGFVAALPRNLSGGQQQRVAIARALVRRPGLILADEPTASLDRKSGRDVVALMQKLAREQGVTVVLVTHDNRILDVADRILHLEDGRLSSFGDAVLSSTRHLMNMLAEHVRKGELVKRVAELPLERFALLLDAVTQEARSFLKLSEAASQRPFESMLEQALEAFTLKTGEVLNADRASLWLLDEERGELWSKVARGAEGEPIEIRVPRGKGIAGAAALAGTPLNVPDAYADPRFDAGADARSGYRTRSILCLPLADAGGRVFGVAQVLNRRDGQPFDAQDEARFRDFMRSLGVILESWWRMSQGRRA